MVNKEFYFKWTEDYDGVTLSGIFYIGVKGTTVSLKKLSGNSIRSCTLSNIILSWEPLREAFQESLKIAPDRTNNFGFMTRKGMSGCYDDYIVTSIKGTKYCRKNKVWHISQFGKFNEDLDIYIRDLVDYEENSGVGFTKIRPINDLKEASANLDEAELLQPNLALKCEKWLNPCSQVDDLSYEEEITDEPDYSSWENL